MEEENTPTPAAETPAAAPEATTIPALEPTADAVAEAVADTVAATVPETAEAPVAVTTEQAVPVAVEDAASDDSASGLNNPQTVILVLVALAVVALVVSLLSRRGGKSSKTGQQDSGGKAAGKGDVVEIYVGNLSYDMTEAQFRKEFERFGVVKSARVIGHRTSGKSKGYGFVEMPHRKEALVAIKALNNRDVMGRKLRVNEARNGTVPRD